jgi:hypothetical protein
MRTDADISRYQDGDNRRHYTDGEVDVLSVTTVLDELEEDKTGLRKWKQSNDGVDDNAHYSHLYWYSAPRGTLCHYQALCLFEDAYAGEEMWDEEETVAMSKLLSGPTEDELDAASTDESDVVYSILKNQGRVDTKVECNDLFSDETLVSINRRDCEYFVDAFKEICEELGVDEYNVISIEKYLLNDEDGYGGQCDMVYEDPMGNTVVADLKTSSSLREKHRLQTVAYGKAVEKDRAVDVYDIDRHEVWRIDPDDREWQVHADHVPTHIRQLANDGHKPWTDSYTDHGWFEDPWNNFEYDSIEDMWTTFQELCEQAHEQPQATKSYNSDGV